MYKLLSIENDDVTRFIRLQNLGTNEIEECFDDSALVSDKNFGFMKVGQVYDCKIKLFGQPVFEKDDKGILCKVIEKDILVGKKNMIKIIINNNEYYIPKQKVVGYLNKGEFNFYSTRKDLIQVEHIIHADML